MEPHVIRDVLPEGEKHSEVWSQGGLSQSGAPWININNIVNLGVQSLSASGPSKMKNGAKNPG